MCPASTGAGSVENTKVNLVLILPFTILWFDKPYKMQRIPPCCCSVHCPPPFSPHSWTGALGSLSHTENMLGEHLVCARPWARPFVYVILKFLTKYLWSEYHYSHPTNEEKEAQRSRVKRPVCFLVELRLGVQFRDVVGYLKNPKVPNKVDIWGLKELEPRRW